LGSLSGDAFATRTSSEVGQGTHNKWILVLVAASGVYRHDAAMAVTASTADTNVTTTTTNAINSALILKDTTVLLIQHPILEMQPTFQYSSSKVYYVNPTSSHYSTLCYNYSPLTDKNDVITKVVGDGQDAIGFRISTSLAAAFSYNVAAEHFYLSGTTYHPTISDSYESPVIEVYSPTTTAAKIRIFSDLGHTWTTSDALTITKRVGEATSSNCNETFTASAVSTAPNYNGRATVWLAKGSAFTMTVSEGDTVSPSLGPIVTGRSTLFIDDTTGMAASTSYWLGGEYIYVTDITCGTQVECIRCTAFTSSTGYATPYISNCHLKGCPIFSGDCHDHYDYYDGSGTNDSPIKTYGLNTRRIAFSKVTDNGTMELALHSILRSKCKPTLKGDMNVLVAGLNDPSANTLPLEPGAKFQVNYFGTVQPGESDYYEIISIDMDIDSGSAKIQFGEYDLNLLQSLAKMGLNIDIT
jgi:hypothetical protein